MRRAWVCYLLVVGLLVACMRWPIARADWDGIEYDRDMLYLHGSVQPPAGFVLVRVIQRGVVHEALTDSHGEWGVVVRWRAGSYRLECDDATAEYEFGVPQGTPNSGPWVFRLMQPTVTPSGSVPTTTATPTATDTLWPQPNMTPLLLRLQATEGDFQGEFIAEVWVDESGAPETIHLSGALWRDEWLTRR